MTRNSTYALAADIVVVVTFILLGRDTHDSPFDIAESIRIAAPFMAGLGVAWLIPLTRHRALQVVTGVLVGGVTAAIGITLRAAVWGDGISGAFPIVTIGYMVGLMSAYRLIFALRRRQRA